MESTPTAEALPSQAELGTSPPSPRPAGQPTRPPSPKGDLWFSEDEGTHDDPFVRSGDATREPNKTKASWKTWAAASLGATVIGAASVVGISAAASKMSQTNATSGAARTGAMPGMPGQGTPGIQGGMPTGGPGMLGTVDGIDGSALKVSSSDGTSATVVTNSSTVFTEMVAGSVGDLHPGDNVTVMGTPSGESIDAQRIVDTGDVAQAGPGAPGQAPGSPRGAAPQGQGQRAGQGQAPGQGRATNGSGRGGANQGVIGAVEGSTITLRTADGSEVTVTTSSSTQVTVQQPSSLEDIEIGDQVRVTGAADADGTITAATVQSGVLPGPGAQGPGAQGPGAQGPGAQGSPNGQGQAGQPRSGQRDQRSPQDRSGERPQADQDAGSDN